MAAQTENGAKAPKAETSKTKTAPAKTPKADTSGVTLYNVDGREKTVTSPAVQTQLEFSGWSRNPDVFKKSDSK